MALTRRPRAHTAAATAVVLLCAVGTAACGGPAPRATVPPIVLTDAEAVPRQPQRGAEPVAPPGPAVAGVSSPSPSGVTTATPPPTDHGSVGATPPPADEDAPATDGDTDADTGDDGGSADGAPDDDVDRDDRDDDADSDDRDDDDADDDSEGEGEGDDG